MAENEVPTSRGVPGVVPPTPVTLAVPASESELADTAEQFIASVQTAGMKSLKSMLAQFMEKADAAITKLDGGVPPKKQD